jgi:hypothetical protein
MKHLFVFALAACLFSGCRENYTGRYPIDTMTTKTEGSGQTELANETFPLNAWFEIDPDNAIRIHEGGVTSVYPKPKVRETNDGFEAVSDDPQGLGVYSWSFEKADEAGVCSLTLSYDGVHSLIMLSKGKDLQ